MKIAFSALRDYWMVPIQPALARIVGWRAAFGFALCFALPYLFTYAGLRVPTAKAHPLVVISAGTTAVTLAYLVLVRAFEWRRVFELGVRPLPRELGIGLLLGGLTCLGIAGGSLVLGAWLGSGAAEGFSLATTIRAFVLSRQFAIIEEIAFRGLLLRWLLGRFTPDSAVALQALAFGLVHYPQGGWPHVTLAAIMGLAFGYAFVWRRSLWTPIGLHFAWDFFALLPGAPIESEPGIVATYVWLFSMAFLLTRSLRRWAAVWGSVGAVSLVHRGES